MKNFNKFFLESIQSFSDRVQPRKNEDNFKGAFAHFKGDH